MEHSFFKHCPINEAKQFTSPLISAAMFKEQCASLILPEILTDTKGNHKNEDKTKDVLPIEKKHQELAQLLQTDTQTAAELEEVCSIDKLKCDNDEKYDYYKLRAYQDFSDDIPLQTVKVVKQVQTKVEELYYAPTFVEPATEVIKDDDITVASDEVVINVAVYHPEKRKPQQEFYVVGSQKLTELRDCITCRADHIIFGEFSHNPNLTGVKTSKELSYSSFFFIENCFYNDTRNPLNRDYSKIIIEWAKDSERFAVPGLGMFQSSIMQDVTFEDLQIRLGYPYLFCHQGNCEHIIVFNDMRIIADDDPHKLSSYPYKISEAQRRHKRCSVCNIHLIKWMTVNDSLAFEDPSFFCDKCFHYLHYSKDRKKLGTFEAYPYFETD